ncbi:hypothetical protein OIU83_16070 [Flavobacterium sp. LS1R49]|uniref:Uncharacterized protein n=1 Tax=Flavobacterium shii TaxID=2987687 RepID=A0A9X2ZK83_9FLAO|nr:hypothetical protein [Flavobacterium shii]MCV9929183.1 hypothetical protein [Flavobacterium shii]
MKNTITEEAFEGRPAIELTVGSFIICSILFTLYVLVKDNSYILIVGFLFTVAALFLNVIMLFHLLGSFIKLPNQREYIGCKILILLSNIPIALLYYTIIMKLNLL